ncbi:unnamed protein product [Sympodiomycopsis kandeliae]
MYLHPLPPAPRPVDFAACLISTSSSSVSSLHLSKATQLRENVRAVLSSGASNGIIEVKLVQAIEDYLPCVIAIFNCCQTDEVVHTRDIWYIWYPLLAPPVSSSKKSYIGGGGSSGNGPFASTSILFELDHILILYSLALSNLAVLQYISVGSYEFDRRLCESERKSKETILKRGITLSRKAIQVITWLIQDGNKDSMRRQQQQFEEGYFYSRSRFLQGLLDLLYIPPTLISLRLLLSAAICNIQSTGELPPPLPKGHPSPSLLAKLFLEIPRLRDQVASNFAAAAGLASLDDVSSGDKGNGLRKLLPQSNKSTTPTDSGTSSKLSSRFKGLGLGSKKKNDSASDNPLYRSTSNDQRIGVGGAGNGPEGGGLSGNGTSPPEGAADNARHGGSSTMSSVLGTQRPSDTSAPPSCIPISKRLIRYIDSIGSWGQSTALFYLALSIGEQPQDHTGGGGHGEAIVWLRMSLEELELILEDEVKLEEMVGKQERIKMDRHYEKSKSGNEKGSKEVDKDRSWQYKTEQRQQQQMSDSDQREQPGFHPLHYRLQMHNTHLLRSLRSNITHSLEIYTKLNNSITFSKLPFKNELVLKIPNPRSILETSSADHGDQWKCPRPEFGPGSIGRHDDEERKDGVHGATEDSVGGLINGDATSADKEGSNEYVGQGAYY